MEKKIKVIEPRYFKEFSCIGGSCESSCCIGWDIDIDKATFKQYFNVKNEKMKKMFQKNLYNNRECTSSCIDYGKVKLNKDKRCPFLDERNYCIIYSNIGEEYLSNVCTHFPRVMNLVEGKFEISLDIACPEAARIILSKKEGIEFIEAEEIFKKYIISGEIKSSSDDLEYFPIKHFKEIRDYSIKILQNRKYSLDERLYILGDFISALEDEAEYDYDTIEEFIEEYDMDKGSALFRRDNRNYILQVSFFNNMVKSLDIYNKIENVAFKKYTKEVIDVFNIEDNDNIEHNSDKYIDFFNNYNNDVIEDKNYIFENYLVNFVYNNLFPFSESESMFDGYIMLLLRYSFMRYYLVAKHSFNKTDSVQEIIKFIQAFSKVIEHDNNCMPHILNYLKENYFDNMEFAQMII